MNVALMMYKYNMSWSPLTGFYDSAASAYFASQLTPHPQAPPSLACGFFSIRKDDPMSSVA